MTVCNFWMQGRCRYGDKCWNEHPKGGGGGGGNYNHRPPQQSSRDGGGFGNRVWVNPAQRSGGGNYVQPSSFSSQQGGDDWGRGGGRGGGGGNNWGPGGGGGRDSQVKSSNFSFAAASPNQNRFSALSTPSSFDRGGSEGEDNEKHLETIQKDMEIWETSGQWLFSCYSVLKKPISGFTELSPEELRLEYYNTKPSGELQGYVNVINQLLNQWRSRVQELRAMSGNTRVAMLAELDNPAPQAASGGFGSTPVTGFGSSAPSGFGTGFGVPAQASVQDTTGFSSFSFAAPSAGGFGSAAPKPAASGFGSAVVGAAPAPAGIGSTATSVPSAAGFSFAAPAANKDPTTAGFGASASGFSFTSMTTSGGGFRGSGIGSAAPVAESGFGQASGGFGGMVAGTGATGGAANSLFSPQSQLSEEELKEFGGKRFTLGRIPLRPPPVDMLVV
ncbi:nucleoporin-like protein 2 [Salmo salar]|uniref:Nucleoporin NUP42 n=1 Tax=Salmo salar TaxID=8030 RepID=B5X1Y4_SALSA|nr:nucleoporin-like protein 2 [Salmo salar]ACI33315.1 Nucleoporin-like 2 [Salmo salar]|eukprot:NP_001133477.1 nucleoporin-like protein 2 [Salmo salar]